MEKNNVIKYTISSLESIGYTVTDVFQEKHPEDMIIIGYEGGNINVESNASYIISHNMVLSCIVSSVTEVISTISTIIQTVEPAILQYAKNLRFGNVEVGINGRKYQIMIPFTYQEVINIG